MNPPCRRCGRLGLCENCLANPDYEFAVPSLTELAELGVDMPLGDMCRPVNQSRSYRPSTHRIRTTLAKGVYL